MSAGLDYPGVGPEHAWLKDSGRAKYAAATDAEALAAFARSPSWKASSPRSRAPTHRLRAARAERGGADGAVPLGHRPLHHRRRGPAFDPADTRFAAGDLVIVNLWGRGDKDVHEAARLLEEQT